jgi:hypothetical protein
MTGGRWCQCDNLTISHNEGKSHECQQQLHWRKEAAVAAESADKKRAAGERAFAADRRHWRSAMARAVKTTATRATKKARGSRTTRVRVTRVIMETSLREEGDDGHNNQLVGGPVGKFPAISPPLQLTKSNSKKNQKNRTDHGLTTAPFPPNPISMNPSCPPPSTRDSIPFAKQLPILATSRRDAHQGQCRNVARIGFSVTL